MKAKKIVLAIFIFLCICKIPAQETAKSPKLDYDKKIPEKLKLLSKNTMVYIYVMEKEAGFLLNQQENTCPTIKEVASRFHQSIKETGINPVIYTTTVVINDKDFKIKTENLIKKANDMNVTNMIQIVLHRDFIKNKIKENWSITAFEFNGTDSYYDDKQKSYLSRNDNYDELIAKFIADISKAKLKKEEMVFPETPNIIGEEPIRPKRYFTSYPENIKNAKFLHHKYEKMDVIGGGISKMYLSMYNGMIEPNNEQLKSILTKSGLNYELISFSETDSHKNDDNTYLIMNIPTSEANREQVAKKSDGFRTTTNASGKVVKANGPTGTESKTTIIVYYYTYIKNIKTNEIYFIDYWSEGDNQFKISDQAGKDPQFRSLNLMLIHLKK